ncbi:superoxide dismutase [Cu-Zn]-like isoform X2 [Haemaphysalis longicornis]|uniref:Superoxide dismutase [Cu-Zn] n=1 Tax=Haemaphysalis longicornis TaxID=44386 RepID=A0A9E8GD16_HAELO|nr:superoxide dismutase 4 [Haemaphysalis longicornis]
MKNLLMFHLAAAILSALSAQQDIRKAVCVFQGSNISGSVTFRQDPGENMTVEGNITGLPKGPHGFHVHQYGDLRNGCASTGGHYNPLNKSHGAPDAAERHVGDLGNINASESGPLSFCLSDQLLNLTGENSIIGRAIVVHAEEDDLGLGNHSQSLTTGNAGARLACCVIGIAAS